MKTKQQQQICTRIINENIKRVMANESLTISLRELKCDCRFMDFYNHWCDVKFGSRNKQYYQKPEVKARIKEYHQKPEVKAKVKEYKKQYYQSRKQKTK